MNELEGLQNKICEKYGSKFQRCNMAEKVGISKSVQAGEVPIHGVRTKAENGTTGWYLWAGEWSDSDDFFVPLHAHHLDKYANYVLPFLGLAEGWRFIVDDQRYEDVWFNPAQDRD